MAAPTQDPNNTAYMIMDALVDGLRLKDEQLQQNAVLALTVIGRKALPFLEEKAKCKKTKPVHRERLLRVAQWLETFGSKPGNEGRTVVNYLIDALRVGNKSLNQKAADALCGLSADVVDRLVPVAFLNWKKAGYCVRLLGVIERIGQISNAENHMNLIALAGRGNERIHEAVRRAMMSAHPQKRDVLGGWDRLGRRDADG